MKVIETGKGTIDLTGKVFGRLRVLGPVGYHTFPNGKRHILWMCSCQCGLTTKVIGKSLRSGRTKSCGCGQTEKTKSIGERNFKHGLKHTAEYKIWSSIRGRCRSSARGISMCSQWDDFLQFLQDVGQRPSSKHSLNRYPDQNGNYEPGNVRWATSAERAMAG